MKYLVSIFLAVFLFTETKIVYGQGLSAQVIESVFYVQPNGGGEWMVMNFRLDKDSLYYAIEAKIKTILNVEEIGLLQNSPFIFTKRKNKHFKNLTKEDHNKANSTSSDLYLIIFLDVDPPFPSLMSAHLIKTAVTLEVYVFDKNLQLLQKMKGKKANTGITTSPEEDDFEDLGFFDLDRESFLYLFDKALKKL